MRSSMSRLFVGLLAAPLMLVSSAAMAGNPCAAECSFLPNLNSISECSFDVTGGCSAQCTPLNVVAECDAECTGSASVSCTGSCNTTCMAQCTVNPGSFSCSTSCEGQCKADCQSGCTDSACTSDCDADCSGRCQVSCQAVPPSATCEENCQASCQGSCTVQDNIMCHAGCSVSATGGCTVDCKAPTGALFCNGQYVNITKVPACVACLETNGLTVSGSCTLGAGCTGGIGCSTSPTLGAAEERWGMFGIAGLVMGLGLAVSRRRRA